METRLVDNDDRPVPPGTVGEIVHRSPHATLGYYKDEVMTAAAFRNGWFHSGDLGVMTEDGYLTIVDRKKDMIKTGGENVASREVEEAIYQMPAVAEVAVFGVPHPRWVEAVWAVVVPKPGATLTEEAVITHTRALLAGYKTPKRVIIADAVPKTPAARSSNGSSGTSTTTSPHRCDAASPRADSPDQVVLLRTCCRPPRPYRYPDSGAGCRR